LLTITVTKQDLGGYWASVEGRLAPSLAGPWAKLVLLKLTGILVVCSRKGGSFGVYRSRPESRRYLVVVWCKKKNLEEGEGSAYMGKARELATANGTAATR
jgi:hypothetical protein